MTDIITLIAADKITANAQLTRLVDNHPERTARVMRRCALASAELAKDDDPALRGRSALVERVDGGSCYAIVVELR